MAEPSVGLYVPTRGHVWHGTASQLSVVGAMSGIGLPIYVRGVTGAAEVRHEIVKAFLATDKDVLVMCDDDVVPPRHFLQIVDPIIDGDADVVAAAVPIMRPDTIFLPNVYSKLGPDNYVPILEAYEAEGITPADAVGTGCIAISRKVLVNPHMKRPFMPKLAKDGTWLIGEDITFSQRAKAQGFRVCVDLNVWCEHLTELHANSVALAYMKILQEAFDGDEGEEEGDGRQEPDLRGLLPEDVDEPGGVRPAGEGV